MKQKQMEANLVLKSPFSSISSRSFGRVMQSRTWSPRKGQAGPHSGQGHGPFTHTKLRPLTPGHPRLTRWSHKQAGASHQHRRTDPPSQTPPAPLGRAPASRCCFFRSHFLAGPGCRQPPSPCGAGAAAAERRRRSPGGRGAARGAAAPGACAIGPAPPAQRIPLFRSLPPLRQRRWQQCDLAVPASLF